MPAHRPGTWPLGLVAEQALLRAVNELLTVLSAASLYLAWTLEPFGVAFFFSFGAADLAIMLAGTGTERGGARSQRLFLPAGSVEPMS